MLCYTLDIETGRRFLISSKDCNAFWNAWDNGELLHGGISRRGGLCKHRRELLLLRNWFLTRNTQAEVSPISISSLPPSRDGPRSPVPSNLRNRSAEIRNARRCRTRERRVIAGTGGRGRGAWLKLADRNGALLQRALTRISKKGRLRSC